MHFNTYLEKARQLNEFAIDSSWGQGRTIFGGLSAGILYEKMSVLVPQEFTIKFMNLCYSSPLQANIAISLEAELVSSGKSTYQVQAKLRQNQKICVLATATFGKARESRISHHSKRVDLKPHKKLKDISYVENLTPIFLQHFLLSLHAGDLPFSGNTLDHQKGWAQFKEHVDDLSPAHLLALIDAWPPTVLQNYQKPGPGATVQWSINFVELSIQKQTTTDNIYFSSYVKSAHFGYAFTDANIYNAGGEPIASSSQLVMIYE